MTNAMSRPSDPPHGHSLVVIETGGGHPCAGGTTTSATNLQPWLPDDAHRIGPVPADGGVCDHLEYAFKLGVMLEHLRHATNEVARVEVGEAQCSERCLRSHLDAHGREAGELGVQVVGEVGKVVIPVAANRDAVSVYVRARAPRLD